MAAVLTLLRAVDAAGTAEATTTGAAGMTPLGEMLARLGRLAEAEAVHPSVAPAPTAQLPVRPPSPRTTADGRRQEKSLLGGIEPLPWKPGQPGPGCYGVWTRRWNHTWGGVPLDIQSQMQQANSTQLLERIKSGQCPFGTALPGQVTWPTHPTFLEVVAVIYSYIPYVMAFRLLVSFMTVFVRGAVRRRRVPRQQARLLRSRQEDMHIVDTHHLWVLLWLLTALVVDELVIKPILDDPRPGTMMQSRDDRGGFVGSCAESCGMPSSHAALAMGWFTLLFLDSAFRIGAGEVDAPGTCASRCYKFFKPTGWRPWPKGGKILTHFDFVSCMTCWTLTFLPVPISRVVLYDHSVSQVCFGMLWGMCYAVMWWFAVRHLARRYAAPDVYLCGCLLHNFHLPCFDRQQLVENRRDELKKLVGVWHGPQGVSTKKDISISQLNGETLHIKVDGVHDAATRVDVEMARCFRLKWTPEGSSACHTAEIDESCSSLSWNGAVFHKNPEYSAFGEDAIPCVS